MKFLCLCSCHWTCYPPFCVGNPNQHSSAQRCSCQQSKAELLKQSGHFIHWQRNGEGRARPLVAPSPTPGCGCRCLQAAAWRDSVRPGVLPSGCTRPFCTQSCRHRTPHPHPSLCDPHLGFWAQAPSFCHRESFPVPVSMHSSQHRLGIGKC